MKTLAVRYYSPISVLLLLTFNDSGFTLNFVILELNQVELKYLNIPEASISEHWKRIEECRRYFHFGRIQMPGVLKVIIIKTLEDGPTDLYGSDIS